MDAYKKAEKELSKQRVNYSKAIKSLKQATEIYPEFAEAWYQLGECYLAEQDEENARNALQQSLKIDPSFVKPYTTLAQLELQTGSHEKAGHLTAKALELNPNWIPGHYWHAIAAYYLGNLEAAETSIRKVQQSNEAPLYTASHHLLGSIYSERGQYQAAAQEFRLFLDTDPPEASAAEIEATLGQWRQAGLIE
jgi:tetratricopeptide (TPR) repeat protein